MNSSPSDLVKKALATEDIVIIAVIALGFLGSALFFIFNLTIPPIVVAILLGAAVSALVYRFLGGIGSDTTFAIGALKLSGTMAALIGCAYFINTELETQTRHDMDRLFRPHVDRWYAVDKNDGNPITVSVTGAGEIDIPPSPVRERIPLTLLEDNNRFLVSTRAENVLGSISSQELARIGLSFSLGPQLQHFVVTDRLPPGTVNYNLDPLPFKLETGSFSREYSHFRLTGSDATALYEGSIYRKQTQIIRLDTRYYLIAVVEVNHLPQDGHPYAKFAIGEIPLAAPE
jgi:hypothetical protein